MLQRKKKIIKFLYFSILLHFALAMPTQNVKNLHFAFMILGRRSK